MQAMILAAGFGTRLLPYTAMRPKPLFPILGKPLLLLTIERLQKAGFDKVIVNCHHLKEQIAHTLAGISGVYVQEEESILGTGGGLARAFSQLNNEPLLITNGDIYHTLDYKELYDFHQSHDASVTMAMHDYPRFNSVSVQDGEIVSFEKKENLQAFTGLHVIDPHILQDISDQEFSCIISHYKKLLANKEKIMAFPMQAFWTDMGTVNDYLALHEDLLKEKIPVWPEIAIHQRNLSKINIQNWAYIPEKIEDISCQLESCVVWDDAILQEGKSYQNCIVTQEEEKC